MRQETATPAPERLIARIAANQHGVISSTQLISAGLTTSGMRRRVQANRLHRIHRGVYAVGHDGLSQEGRWMAAVLACGEGAVLSHRAAGALWKLLAPPSIIDVTVPGSAGRERRRGIRVHRSATLLPSQTTIRAGIAVTKPARTLEDLRRALPKEEFAQVLREAEFKRLPIGDQFRPDGTRSELEARFIALCRRHHLLTPQVNVTIGPYTVDFLYPATRLIVEVDGWEGHRMRSAFEADRERDVQLKLAGYTVVRFTWRQLERDPAGVAGTVRVLLGCGR